MVVNSPCNAVCQIDPASGFCRGCLRTLDEIARWSAMDDAQRRRVLDDLARRAAQAAQPCSTVSHRRSTQASSIGSCSSSRKWSAP